jgi:2-polyprenyl-3-methyl-5-hydroxy-6-metoxy-1,4-benzoquinol methylase
MSLRDIFFWVHSAKTDAAFEKLRDELGPQKAFDLLYAEKRDPFCSTQARYRYQRLKYERLISFLPQRQYNTALDVGCGIGPFTRQLAPYVGQALGVDFSAAAIEVARSLSTSVPNVQFEQHDVLRIEKIGRQFDLITVLDVLYYLPQLSDDVLKSIALQLEGLLAPDGLLMLVNHFFFGIDPASRQTRRIHNAFGKCMSARSVSEHRRPFFLFTIYARE